MGAVAGNLCIAFETHQCREGEGSTGPGRAGIAQERSKIACVFDGMGEAFYALDQGEMLSLR
jgi:hypothetical protein